MSICFFYSQNIRLTPLLRPFSWWFYRPWDVSIIKHVKKKTSLKFTDTNRYFIQEFSIKSIHVKKDFASECKAYSVVIRIIFVLLETFLSSGPDFSLIL